MYVSPMPYQKPGGFEVQDKKEHTHHDHCKTNVI